jgi:hypothetical protein
MARFTGYAGDHLRAKGAHRIEGGGHGQEIDEDTERNGFNRRD